MLYINNDLETETRYDLIKFLTIQDDNLDPLDSFMLANIPDLKENGTYTITKEAGRPDLLSYSIYQDTQYWWMLMWYNSILSIDELVVGLTISYPFLSGLEDFYIEASTYQKTV